jgi:putative component of toxin-antitoxin plasmid stabilization module
MEQVRELVFYRHYFHEFFDRQSDKVKGKIDYVLFLMTHAERVPEKFLMHLEGQKGLYEIRVEVGSNIYRIFCCFDKGKIVVLFNGFQKKKQKTPKAEIEFAIKLMNEYFDNKQ